MSRRFGAFAVLLFAFALLAAACGGTAETTTTQAAVTTTTTTTAAPTTTTTTTTTEAPTTTAAPDESTTTTTTMVRDPNADLVIWADDTRTPVVQKFADQFGQENNLTVAVQELAFGDIRDRLIVAGPVGEGPDIIIGAHDWLGQLVTSGVLAPIDLSGIQDQFSDASIQAFNYGGQIYGLPYAVENIALLRNTDLVPEAPATFEDLTQTALDLVDQGKATIPLALQEGPADPYHNYPMFSALGGYVFGLNADGSYNPDDVGIDSPGGLKAAQWFADRAADGLIDSNTTYDIMIESFGSGDAPFAITGPWAVADPDRGFKATGVPYVVEPIPPVEGGTPHVFIGVQGFMISAFAENPLVAQTFLTDFMATEDAQYQLYQAGGRPPANLAAFEKASADPDIEGFGKAGINGDPQPSIPEMGSVWQAWTDAYQLVLTGSDPEQAFKDAAAQIRAQIAAG